MSSFSFALDNITHNVIGSSIRCFNFIGLSYGYELYQNMNPKEKLIKYSSKRAAEFIAETANNYSGFNIEKFDGIIGTVLIDDDSVSSTSKSINITDCDNKRSLANNDIDKFLSDSAARGEVLLYASNNYDTAPLPVERNNYVDSQAHKQKMNAKRLYIVDSWKKKDKLSYKNRSGEALDLYSFNILGVSYDETNILKIDKSINAIFWINKSAISDVKKSSEDNYITKEMALSGAIGFTSACAILFYFSGHYGFYIRIGG